MSMDTENKRRSSFGLGMISLTIYQTPSSTIDKAGRRHKGSFYRGVDTLEVLPKSFWREVSATERPTYQKQSSTNIPGCTLDKKMPSNFQKPSNTF